MAAVAPARPTPFILYASVNQEGDIGVFVDMLKLGSDTSIYNDQSLTIPERATRLLIDTLAHIQAVRAKVV